MGFSNLFADGLSMGLGDYISGKAEKKYSALERKREVSNKSISGLVILYIIVMLYVI